MVPEEGLTVGGTHIPCLQIPVKIRLAPNASTPPPPPPPPATPRKNKAAMCKPLMQNRGVSCKVEMKSKGSQTGEPGCLDSAVLVSAVLGLRPCAWELAGGISSMAGVSWIWLS